MPLIINVFIAGLLTFGLRWAWHSPLLAPMWDKAHIKQPVLKLNDPKTLTLYLASSFLGAWIFGWLYLNMPQQGLSVALMTAVVIWIAFFLPNRAISLAENGQKPQLLWLEGGYYLAALLINAFIFWLL
jgi:Protein of unknown function (DUF1761)